MNIITVATLFCNFLFSLHRLCADLTIEMRVDRCCFKQLCPSERLHFPFLTRSRWALRPLPVGYYHKHSALSRRLSRRGKVRGRQSVQFRRPITCPPGGRLAVSSCQSGVIFTLAL